MDQKKDNQQSGHPSGKEFAAVCREALELFGVPMQSIKAIEEMAELTMLLAKISHTTMTAEEFQHTLPLIRDEIIDCTIILNQLVNAYFSSPESYYEAERRKIEKLKRIIAGEKIKRGRKSDS